MTTPLLSVDGVEAGYGEHVVLRRVSLVARAAEVTALVGPNGAGKSTLLRAIAGLLRITGGAITLEGRRVDNHPAWEMVAAGLVLVPERRRLFLPLPARENLELGAFLPRARAARGETLEQVFRLFPVLREKQDLAAGALADGEQRMLALATGLMARPRVLCLDDPFVGLAPAVTERVCEALRGLAAQGTAVLAASQHVGRLLRLADRAYLLDEGLVVLAGSGAELLASVPLRRALLSRGVEPAG